ncbi:hypothetical protein [Streptomyces sp. NPDC096132]|uniref:hypothetical protein n=1 Tax=Streptomyces sp. NPDC096132 TaxID=3366075 RepID=UPI0038043FEF
MRRQDPAIDSPRRASITKPHGKIATGTHSGGKVTITLPRLSRGRHTLHVYYAGSSTVNARNGANFVIRST